MKRLSIAVIAAGVALSPVLHAQEAASTSSSARDAESSDSGDDGEPGMRSGFAFGLGIGMMTVAAAGVAASGAIYASREDACDAVREHTLDATRADIDGCVAGKNQQVGAVVGMVAGGALFLFGLPVTIVGGTSSEAAPPPTVTGALGLGSGEIQVHF